MDYTTPEQLSAAMERVPGAWIGVQDRCGPSYLMILHPDFTGVLYALYTYAPKTERMVECKISLWSMTGATIKCSFAPINYERGLTNAECLYAGDFGMSGILDEPTGAKVKVTFWRADPFTSQVKELMKKQNPTQ